MTNLGKTLLRFGCLLWLWTLLIITSLGPSATFAYDGHRRPTVSYDDKAELGFLYDANSVLATGEETSGVAEECALLAKSSKSLAAETTAGQTYQIMDGVRRSAAANLTGATTIQAEILDANMVSQGIRQVPMNSLLSPKEFIDLSGSGAYRWNRVLEGTRTGARLPPIQITPGSSIIPIRNVTIGNP